jgi:hypothetical protein
VNPPACCCQNGQQVCLPEGQVAESDLVNEGLDSLNVILVSRYIPLALGMTDLPSQSRPVQAKGKHILLTGGGQGFDAGVVIVEKRRLELCHILFVELHDRAFYSLYPDFTRYNVLHLLFSV